MTREEFWNKANAGFEWLQQVFEFAEVRPMRPRSDQHSMAFPIFALAPGDCSELQFTDERSGVTITIAPAHKLGRATIEDRDLLLFAISLIAPEAAKNEVDWLEPRWIKFRLIDFFRFIRVERPSATQIKRVETALDRLQRTQIKTSLETNSVRQLKAFSLITSYQITEPSARKRGRGHAIQVELQLCEWLTNAIVAKKELLNISSDYFKLRPLERRLYELARKHCGFQPEWPIGYDRLFKLVGSRQARKYLMAELREIAAKQPLPGYTITLTDTIVRFTNKQRYLERELFSGGNYEDY